MTAADSVPVVPVVPVVLVVDDDDQICEVVREALEPEGYAVWQAAHGEAALDLLDERASADGSAPAVILLDLHMPVMDGWRFAHEYRQRPVPLAALIAFTASKIQGPVAGTAATIRKPFAVDELLDLVQRHAPAPPT
ncbi:MAG TPA: response regulator [Chloroflexota bacterium]|nr:response regulator [Chloroflexota bacterium]